MSAKPKLPSAVYDALVSSGKTDVAAQYNRADEAEPAAPVVVVVNVNLNYEMSSVDQRRGGVSAAWIDPLPIARHAEQVRDAITRALRVTS